MKSASVGLNLVEPTQKNEKGGSAIDESVTFRHECTFKIIHPEYVLFANDVGSNTNQKVDKSYVGEKRLAK